MRVHVGCVSTITTPSGMLAKASEVGGVNGRCAPTSVVWDGAERMELPALPLRDLADGYDDRNVQHLDDPPHRRAGAESGLCMNARAGRVNATAPRGR